MARIWFNKTATGEELREGMSARAKGTMMECIGIQVTEIGDDYLVGRMAVDHRTRQIYGILHGGASAALAETLGSMGAALCVDPTRFQCVGIEINANHLASVANGAVVGRATPLHLGRRSQVWEIKITAEDSGKLTCVSRLTVMAVEKR